MRLVLLPGLDGTGILFEPLARALRADLAPIICAYPRTEARTYTELLPAILRALPTDEPYILLGESYGGPLSLMIAARRPRGLAGLVLSASFISCPYPFVPAWASRLVVPAPFKVAPAFSRIKSLFEGFSSDELSSLIGRAFGGVEPTVLASRIREVIRVEASDELLACPVLILYIQGSHDIVVPPGNLDRIRAIRPDVDVVRLNGPHMVLQVAAKEAARAIEAFADERENSGSGGSPE